MTDNDALPFGGSAADPCDPEVDIFASATGQSGAAPGESHPADQLSPDPPNPAEVSRLHSLHEDLIEAIHTAVNPTVRDDLVAELHSVRERVVEITGSTTGLDPLPNTSSIPGSERDWSEDDAAIGGALVPVPVPGYDPDANAGRTSPLLGGQMLPLGLAVLAGLGLLSFALFSGNGADPAQDAEIVAPPADAPDPAGATSSGSSLIAIRSLLAGMGYESVSAQEQDGTVLLIGTVPDEATRSQVVASAQSVAAGVPVDADGLVVATPPDAPTSSNSQAALQRELDRLLGATPITFASGEVTLSDRHQRILNNAVPALLDNPSLAVEIVGYTDGSGADEVNLRLSRSRAQNVVAYLQSQGVPASQLRSRAGGESASTGSADLQSLERRVELRVVQAATVPTTNTDELSISLIAPSAANDLSATQSMADALAAISDSDISTVPVRVTVTDNVVDTNTAREVMVAQVEAGARLIVAHGVQFGPAVAAVAPSYPSVVFALGAATDNFGLDNVYAYNAAAEEGGYVLGALASLVSETGTVGFVGPLMVGDAVRYANGFRQGAESQRSGTRVLTDYTGSFSEVGLAAEAAKTHIAEGADVLTGTSPLAVGAIDAAVQANVVWLGNEADQGPLAPGLVAASQVYDWTVVLESILADIEAGEPNGRALTIDFANGGLSVVFNPGYDLDPAIRQEADRLIDNVTSGALSPAA